MSKRKIQSDENLLETPKKKQKLYHSSSKTIPKDLVDINDSVDEGLLKIPKKKQKFYHYPLYNTIKDFEDSKDYINSQIFQTSEDLQNINDIITVLNLEMESREKEIEILRGVYKATLECTKCSDQAHTGVKSTILASLYHSISLYRKEVDAKLDYSLEKSKDYGRCEAELFFLEREKEWILKKFESFKKEKEECLLKKN